MTQRYTLTTSWAKVDTTNGDVLLTTNDCFLLYMNGTTAPTKASHGHLISQPVIIPKGIGAYVCAHNDLLTRYVLASPMVTGAGGDSIATPAP